MLLVHFFSGMSDFCFLWCCYWVTIRQRLNYNFRVGMFDDLFGNNAVTVRIKHSTLHWTCAFRPCTFSPVPVYVSSMLHWTCAFRPCTFSPAPVYVSTRPWTFWPVDVLTRIRSDSVPFHLGSAYLHIKKVYWFKIRMGFLRPILAKIELICQQPAMPRPSGVQGVASQSWGCRIRMAGGLSMRWSGYGVFGQWNSLP